MKYPVAFTGGQRKVFLEGEAYFEVAADTVHPFLVETSGMSVTVLGTGFNVMAYPEEMEAAVTLVHGEVLELVRSGKSVGITAEGDAIPPRPKVLS